VLSRYNKTFWKFKAHALLLATAAGGLAFFIWRWKADPMALAFAAGLIYFTPGVAGVARFATESDPLLDAYSYHMAFEPAALVVMAIVLGALIVAAALADRVPSGAAPLKLSFENYLPGVCLSLAVVAAAISIARIGPYFRCLDKTVTLDKLDVWYHYAAYVTPSAVVTAYALRQWRLFALGWVLLIGDLYAGFRMSLGISIIAVLLLIAGHWITRRHNVVLFACIVASLGGSLFIAKHLIVPLKSATAISCERERGAAGGESRAHERVAAVSVSETMRNLTRPDFYFGAFVDHAEPFVIQSTLNEVVRRDFKTDKEYLVGQLLTGFPLGESLFGRDNSHVTSFNSHFQPALFPEVKFGMANNPWAQAYAAGGLAMVGVFAIVFAAVMALLTLLFNNTHGALRAGVVVLAAWVGFYFHRNDLFIEVVLLKQVVYIFGFALLLAWLVAIARTFRFGKQQGVFGRGI
jgi:hypothetical protein